MEINEAHTLQEEVEVVDGCDAAVDNGARFGVTVTRSVLRFCGVETSVVALAADDDG